MGEGLNMGELYREEIIHGKKITFAKKISLTEYMVNKQYTPYKVCYCPRYQTPFGHMHHFQFHCTVSYNITFSVKHFSDSGLKHGGGAKR